MVLIARQRDDYLRVLYAYNVSQYDSNMLIFIDETGADKRNLLRKQGYSISGKPAKKHKLLHRGQHISVIAAISAKGMLGYKMHYESVNGEMFYKFVLSHLVAHLQPFDGRNILHSVVILDNASIHHTEAAD